MMERSAHFPSRSSSTQMPRQYASRYSAADIDDESDLDAFDRELPAESSATCYPMTEVGAQNRPLSSTTRVAVPNVPHFGGYRGGTDNHIQNHTLAMAPEDLRQHSVPHESSSPLALPRSSPIVSALQNRGQSFQSTRRATSTQLQHDTQTTLLHQNLATAALSTPSRITHNPNGSIHKVPIVRGIPLVPTHRLPDHLRSVFSFDLFNAVQSKCFAVAFETDDNIVVSAPTGSGKTAIMELAVCRMLARNKNQDFKIVYQAPTKSLCSERCRDWVAKFSSLGLQCAELTGEVERANLKHVKSAHIIVTTPEKWDSATRKWKDHARLIQMVKLFLVDEVHILRESRGATLEAVVSRMKSVGSAVRFVALSATIPNSEDIAIWLGQSSTTQHLPAHREVFDETFRPVKLEKHVIGYRCSPNAFALDSMLTKEIPTIIAQYAKRRPILIFCATKRTASKTATAVAESWLSTSPHLRSWNEPQHRVAVVDTDLAKVVPTGVAFHHSGLNTADRQAVERGFLEGNISIICSTSTLAVGVNLPCYLVILKGTSCWTDSGIQEYSSLDVMQMLGRAGRPQYETSACAVILTHQEKSSRYERLVSGEDILESSLHQHLIEHLNAEIGIGTIVDTASAKKWLHSSFLYVRLQQNPTHYRLQDSNAVNDATELLEQICDRDLKLLETDHLIETHDGLRCTNEGDIMARYYIAYETMLVFLKLRPNSKISETLTAISQAHELSDMKLRSGEKAMYKQINKSNDIRYPIKVDVALPAHKTSLIIQARLGGFVASKENVKYVSQFTQDSAVVMSYCSRLIRCVIDVQLGRDDATGVKSALELCRSLAAGVWDNTPMQLKQIESIGEVTARKLAAAGITNLENLVNTEPQRIELILGKSQPFGSTLLKKASGFPLLRVSVKGEYEKKRTKAGPEIRLKCEIGFLNNTLPKFFNHNFVYVCFLCETSYGKIVDFRRFGATALEHGTEIRLTALLEKPCRHLNFHVMCDEVVGTHRYAELKLDIPDEWFSGAESNPAITGDTKKLESKTSDNYGEFDDQSLADAELLAAETSVYDVDVVDDDIDELLDEKRVQKELKTGSTSMLPTLPDAEPHAKSPAEYREPKRLANGRWTCQHTCVDENKDCKHHCCKEGVKRPKKRVKTAISSTSAGMSASTVSSGTKAVIASGRGQKEVQERYFDIDALLQKSVRFRHPSVEEHGSESASWLDTNRVSRKDDPLTDTIMNIEISSDDLPSVNAIVTDHTDKTSDVGPMKQQHCGHEQNYQDIYDIDDIDLGMDGIDMDISSVANIIPQGQVRNITSYESRSCDDGQDKSLLKLNTNSAMSVPASETHENIGFSDCPVAKEKPASIPPRESSPLQDNFESCWDSIDDADLIAADTTYLSSKDIDDSTSRVKDVSNEVQQTVPEFGERHPRSIIPSAKIDETEYEQSRRLHEEDQKRKWSRFPDWMYQQFGSCVDIVCDE